MKIYHLRDIKRSINLASDLQNLINGQRQAFIDFFKGLYVIPQPIQLNFPKIHADSHIKSGYKNNDDIFIVKVANGFYSNHYYNLPNNDGCILVFCQKTGVLRAVVHDFGYLTTLRTSVAAIIAASITPWPIKSIGIIGSGNLAKQIFEIIQLMYQDIIINLWARSMDKLSHARNLTKVKISNSIDSLIKESSIIISATASATPIIHPCNFEGGNKHFITLGADDLHKQECHPDLFSIADAVITDSIDQASNFGNIFHALNHSKITKSNILQLGNVLDNNINLSCKKLIISSLTGIAAQDIAITKYAFKYLEK